MGAYNGLSELWGDKLIEYAVKLGYHESNLLILEGNSNSLKSKYPEIYRNLLSCAHHADKRTFIQYGQDLVSSWVFEDLFLRLMNCDGFAIKRAGADQERMILPSHDTSASSDYIISNSSGKTLLLELVNDYTGFWHRTETLHLRDNKYLQLKDNKAILVAVSISGGDSSYALFDFSKQINARYISSHRPYGYKPAYEIYASREMYSKLSSKEIRERIVTILNK